MSAKEKLLAFISHAGEVFGYEELTDTDLDIDVARTEDPDHPFYYTDLAREETGEVFRFCLLENRAPLEETLDYFFGQYRELEAEYADEFAAATLLLRPDISGDEDPSFFYVFRTDSGEIGLFHSELSLEAGWGEEDDEEDEDEETGGEDLGNGRPGIGGR